jgi:hypothetical protein
LPPASCQNTFSNVTGKRNLEFVFAAGILIGALLSYLPPGTREIHSRIDKQLLAGWE